MAAAIEARLTRVQFRVLQLLKAQPNISFDVLSGTLDIDRKSARIAVVRLESLGLIRCERGRGPVPNHYEYLGDRHAVSQC